MGGCCGIVTSIADSAADDTSTSISGCERLGGAASGLLISGRRSLTSSLAIGESRTAGADLISSIVISLSSCMGGKIVCSFSFARGVSGTAAVLAIDEIDTGLSSCMGGRELSSPVDISGKLSRSLFTLSVRSVC